MGINGEKKIVKISSRILDVFKTPEEIQMHKKRFSRKRKTLTNGLYFVYRCVRALQYGDISFVANMTSLL